MLSVEHVTKVYKTRRGYHRVLDDVSFVLERGRNIGILGRNGAGKSTMIRLLAGAERPTMGRIRRNMRVSWPLAFGGGPCYSFSDEAPVARRAPGTSVVGSISNNRGACGVG